MPKNIPLPGTELLTRTQRVRLAGMRRQAREAEAVLEGYRRQAAPASFIERAERYVREAQTRLTVEMTKLGVPTTTEN
jgi:hypothetical protein